MNKSKGYVNIIKNFLMMLRKGNYRSMNQRLRMKILLQKLKGKFARRLKNI
jgi:hypothetical protein